MCQLTQPVPPREKAFMVGDKHHRLDCTCLDTCCVQGTHNEAVEAKHSQQDRCLTQGTGDTLPSTKRGVRKVLEGRILLHRKEGGGGKLVRKCSTERLL